MAVSASLLTASGSVTAGSSVATASVTPTANALVLAWIHSSDGAATSVTGNGLTWVQIATAGGVSTEPTTVYRAMGASPSSGAVTFNFGGTQSEFDWVVVEYSGTDTSGTNGSGAIVQSNTNEDTGTPTSLTVTLSSGIGAGNATVAAIFHHALEAQTAGGSYTKLGESAATGVDTLAHEWLAAGTTTPSMSWTTGARCNGIAVEIKSGTVVIPDIAPVRWGPAPGRLSPSGLWTPWQGTGVAAAGQTIAVGQAVETESGLLLAVPVNRALSVEAAQTITVVKVVPVGQATETEVAQAVAAAKTRAAGQATETEVAQSVGKAKVKAAAQASETELAQAITVRKTVAVGQAVETELGQTVGKAKVKAAGQATETELGQTVGRLKRVGVAQATEEELAQAITSTGHKFIAVGQAVETETGQTFTRVKVKALAQAAETEAAQALTKRLGYALGQAVEDETGQAVLTGVHVSSPPGRIVVGSPGGTIVLLRSGAAADLYTDVYSDAYAITVGPPGVVHIEQPAGTLTIGG